MNTSDSDDNECTVESVLKTGHEETLVCLLQTKKPQKNKNGGSDFGLLPQRFLHWGDRWLSGWLPSCSQWQVNAASVQLSDKKRSNVLAILLSPGA